MSPTMCTRFAIAIAGVLGAVALDAGVVRAEPAVDAAPSIGVDWWSIPARDTAVARAVAEVGLRRGHVWAPVTLAPDLAVGVADRVAVLVDSSRASEARLGAGNGVCVRPPNETVGMPTTSCPSTDVGLEVGVLYGVADHTVLRAGLFAHDWSPLAIAAEVGAATTVQAGRAWAEIAPTLVLGLTARDDGNRARVQVPVYLGVTPRPPVELHLRSGLDGTLATFGDTYSIPIGAGASVRLARVRIGVDVTLDKAVGPLNATLWRSALVFVEAPVGTW
jgi:hypothetical protein